MKDAGCGMQGSFSLSREDKFEAVWLASIKLGNDNEVMVKGCLVRS